MMGSSNRVFWITVSVLLACEPGAQQSASPTEAPAVSGSIPSDWATEEQDASVVVARVNGTPLTRQMVLDVQAASVDLDARVALERLIDLEVLAQRAVRLGKRDAVNVQQVRRESLVQRYLSAGFESDVTPESLPLAKVQEIYYVPSVRKLYDHADAWRMAHVFFTCCDAKTESCDSPEILQCFVETGETIQTVYSELKNLTADVEGDPEAIAGIFEVYRRGNQTRFVRHPFAFRTVPFYYDPAKLHDEQKGYNIIAEAVARTVTDGPTAIVQPPVQSPFGWHVIVKLDHDPEVRRGPDAPEVIADIRENMLPKIRQARFGALLRRLAQEQGVELDAAPLELLKVRFNARL